MADADWRAELDGWLEPFLTELGHGKRRRWAPVYLRGLLGPGECKSLQPMAARLGLEGHDQLQPSANIARYSARVRPQGTGWVMATRFQPLSLAAARQDRMAGSRQDHRIRCWCPHQPTFGTDPPRPA